MALSMFQTTLDVFANTLHSTRFIVDVFTPAVMHTGKAVVARSVVCKNTRLRTVSGGDDDDVVDFDITVLGAAFRTQDVTACAFI